MMCFRWVKSRSSLKQRGSGVAYLGSKGLRLSEKGEGQQDFLSVVLLALFGFQEAFGSPLVPI